MNPLLESIVDVALDPKYGDKVDVRKMKKKYFKSDKVEDGLRTQIYQAILLNKEFASSINVVIVLKTNLSTHGASPHHSIQHGFEVVIRKSISITTPCAFKLSSTSGTPSSIGAWMIL